MICTDIFKHVTDRHEMLIDPFTIRIERERHIISWRQIPWLTPLEYKRKVLGVIITVGRHNIEAHPAEYLSLR
jgi:hypothetical protein